MLRVTLIAETQRTVLKAEGKLTGPWVKELDHCWQMLLHTSQSEHMLVDLSDVEFVDSAGKELIRRICNKGVDVMVTGPMMTAVLQEIVGERSPEVA